MHCPDDQTLATAREALLQKDESWDVTGAAKIAHHAVVGDLVSGQWAVQDCANEGQAKIVGYDGSALHGFESTVANIPEPATSEDGDGTDGVHHDTLHMLLLRHADA